MMQYTIKLSIDKVNDFVKAATECQFDIDISYNSFIVDAKSIVGVLGLDFRRKLTVTCSDYDPDFDMYMRQFAVAC